MHLFVFSSLSIISLWAFCMNNNGKENNSQSSVPQQFRQLRENMVLQQIKKRGIQNQRVLSAMSQVPRHLFVPQTERSSAYKDTPLPIGYDQTISQPYIVAYMTEKLDLKADEKVLEIGTGSGYQAAILGELVKQVYSIEIVNDLCESAKERLKSLGYKNIFIKCGDGYRGWPEQAPFDAILITAAPKQVPIPLLKQLKVGGRLIAPVGKYFQELVLITKRKDESFTRQKLIPVRFCTHDW